MEIWVRGLLPFLLKPLFLNKSIEQTGCVAVTTIVLGIFCNYFTFQISCIFCLPR
jgi:hypothetical protein